MSKILNTILQIRKQFSDIATTNADTLAAIFDGEVGGPYTMVIDEDNYFMFNIIEVHTPTSKELFPAIQFLKQDGSTIPGWISLPDWDFTIPPEMAAKIDTCSNKAEDTMYKAIKASEDAMAVYAYSSGVASQLSVSTTVDSSVLQNEYEMAVSTTAQGQTDTLDEVHQTVMATADPATGKVTQMAFLSVIKSVWGKLKALLPANSLKLPDSGVFYLNVIADLLAVTLKAVFQAVIALVEAVLAVVMVGLYLALQALKALVSIFTADVSSENYVMDPDPDESNLLVNAPLLSAYQTADIGVAGYLPNRLYDVNGLYSCYCVENVTDESTKRTISSVSYLSLSFKGEAWLQDIGAAIEDRELYFDGYTWAHKHSTGSSIRSKGLYLPQGVVANPRNAKYQSSIEEEVVLPIMDAVSLKARYVSNLIAFVYDSTYAPVPNDNTGHLTGLIIPYQIFGSNLDIDDVKDAKSALSYVSVMAGLLFKAVATDGATLTPEKILEIFPFEEAVRCHDRISREFSARGADYRVGLDYGYVNGTTQGAFVSYVNSTSDEGYIDLKGYGTLHKSIFHNVAPVSMIDADGFPQSFTFSLPGYDFITAKAAIKVTKMVAAVTIIAGAAIYFGLRHRKKQRSRKAAADASRAQAEYNANPTPENFKKLNKANKRNARLNKLNPTKVQDPPKYDNSDIYSEIISVGSVIDVDYAKDSD